MCVFIIPKCLAWEHTMAKHLLIYIHWATLWSWKPDPATEIVLDLWPLPSPRTPHYCTKPLWLSGLPQWHRFALKPVAMKTELPPLTKHSWGLKYLSREFPGAKTIQILDCSDNRWERIHLPWSKICSMACVPQPVANSLWHHVCGWASKPQVAPTGPSIWDAIEWSFVPPRLPIINCSPFIYW